MRKMKLIVGLLVILSMALAPTAFAAKREKFGVDKRHEEVKKELRTIKPSEETYRWKMVMPWSKGLLFYDVAQHFADSVKLASGGRLDIKLFSAGELVGAMESFDAVSKGQADIGHVIVGLLQGFDYCTHGDISKLLFRVTGPPRSGCARRGRSSPRSHRGLRGRGGHTRPAGCKWDGSGPASE